MQIVENTAVKLTIPSDKINLITDYIERSEVISNDGTLADVLVYWGIEEMQHLTKVCPEEIPSPIEKDYS